MPSLQQVEGKLESKGRLSILFCGCSPRPARSTDGYSYRFGLAVPWVNDHLLFVQAEPKIESSRCRDCKVSKLNFFLHIEGARTRSNRKAYRSCLPLRFVASGRKSTAASVDREPMYHHEWSSSWHRFESHLFRSTPLAITRRRPTGHPEPRRGMHYGSFRRMTQTTM